MIRFDDADCPIVRAVLTLHEQSQVDHVNDQRLEQAASKAGRACVFRNIVTRIELSGARPRAELSFVSHRNEVVTLLLVCLSQPEASRGGISDPGRHAIGSSLPVMLRGKSALASAASRVEMDGVPYKLPERFRVGAAIVAHDGFFTVSHHMAILRSSRRRLTVIERPRRPVVGQRWRYASADGELVYTITSITRQGDLEIVRDAGDHVETVHGAATASGDFRFLAVGLRSTDSPTDGVSLRFHDTDTFAIDLDRHAAVVTGRLITVGTDGARLEPLTPTWATRRQMHIRWQCRCNDVALETLLEESARTHPHPAGSIHSSIT